MKKILFVFIVFIMVSCKNEATKSSSEIETTTEGVRMDMEREEFYIPENTINDTKYFEHKELTTEKLQELYDVLTLIQKHPEFRESLKSQLKTFTEDSLTVDTSSEIIINNLRIKGPVLKPDDSTQRMKLLFNATSKTNRIQDSILAEVTFKTIIIDGKEMQSKKVKFKRIKEL